MQFGHLALGIASVVLGVHHFSNAKKHLTRRAGDGLSFFDQRAIDPRRATGRASTNTSNGRVTLTTYEVRNLQDRINRIRDLIEQGKRDPKVYLFARNAINKKCGKNWCTPEKNNAAEIAALFNAIRENVRYTSDIRGIDTYQKPPRTLELGTADCDDYSSLACASLESLGIPCALKAIRTKGSPEWNHIYALAGLPRARPTRWIPFDASVSMPVGWEAPRKMVAEARIFPMRRAA